MSLPVEVLICARDEETNLPDCLHSVRGWVSGITVVVDPRTTDRTREIAVAAGARVVDHPFEDFASQKNWALKNLEWTADWVFVLDADERVSPDLREELERMLRPGQEKNAFAVRFRFIFYGKWIRRCWYGTWIIRIFRRDSAWYESRGVHEHMLVLGRVGYLRGDLIHNDFKDMHAWISKHNTYATYEAEELFRGNTEHGMRGRLFGSKVERRRFLKEKIWNRLPFRPLWLFVYLYVLKLGFLDGALGFRFCLMHAIFDSFTLAKLWERRFLARNPPPNYYRKELEQRLARHPEDRAYYD